MMKDRNIICTYYEAKGQCTKGHDAAVFGVCQHCTQYKKKEGARPIRPDNKKRNLERLRKKESRIDNY